MSFLELASSGAELSQIAEGIAHRALNEPFAPITNSGVTPEQLLKRMRSTTIVEKARNGSVIAGDLSEALVQAIDDLKL